jgi:hypothetical protein
MLVLSIFVFLFFGPCILSNEDNKTNKMHKLILRLIYYCWITPTSFGPLIEAIIRESKILEYYKAFMEICLNVGVIEQK